MDFDDVAQCVMKSRYLSNGWQYATPARHRVHQLAR